MIENCPKMIKDIYHVSKNPKELQQNKYSSHSDPSQIPTHNIFKLVETKDKKEILKAAEKNYTKYRASKIRIIARFLSETVQIRRHL